MAIVADSLLCITESSLHSVTATTTAAPGGKPFTLNRGDCYQTSNGERLTLKMPAKYQYDEDAKGSPFALTSIHLSAVQPAGTYKPGAHYQERLVIVKVY